MAGTDTTVNSSQVSSGVVTTTNTFVDTVTLNGETNELEILAYDGADWLWFTVDGTTPAVGGKGSYPIPPIVGEGAVISPSSSENVVVKLIAATPTKYVVSRVPR